MSEDNLDYFKMGDTDCWPFKGDPEEAPNRESKMACGNTVCCNKKHVVSVAVDDGAPKPTGEMLTDDIREVIELLESDNTDHFTGGGIPRVDALIELLGYDITAEERDQALK